MKKKPNNTPLHLAFWALAILLTGTSAIKLKDVTLFLACLVNALLFLIALKQYLKKPKDESPLL